MAIGRKGFQIEAFKFSIYIGLPVIAAAIFNEPDTVRWFVDYYKFVEYPATENTRDNMKKKWEEQVKERERYEEQKREYVEQLRKLQGMSRKRELLRSGDEEIGVGGGGGWWGWLTRRNKKDDNEQQQQQQQ